MAEPKVLESILLFMSKYTVFAPNSVFEFSFTTFSNASSELNSDSLNFVPLMKIADFIGYK